MKIIAFYLPQFHEIRENNIAWGKGFTEWTNVKKAKSLFWGHRQPRVPYNENYYNLMQNGVMESQVELALKYGIYGFCFYHYWFNGKKVLYKPVENMRVNPLIQYPYCFAWANEPWTKTWHGAGGDKEILIRQTYGTEANWKEHYDYLRDFFCDPNYIRIEGKPVFLVYKLHRMRHRSEMFSYFNERAKRDGLNGICLIQMLSDENGKSKLRWVNGFVDFEPARYRNVMRKKNEAKFQKRMHLIEKHPSWNWWNRWMCDVVDYRKFNDELLQNRHEKNHFRCIFVDYDDSPRRGKKGLIFKGSTPEIFREYLGKNIDISEKEGNEFLFINAWNEWGEGNYLEPDNTYGYQYLDTVKSLILGSIDSK